MATVLLVESDPLQAFLCKSMLERQFLDVERVGDAAEALCLVEQSHFAKRLGLVIASHPMQGIGGPAFVAELHARMPEVPVLVLGESGEQLARSESGWVRFLPRPFAMDQMLALANQMFPQPNLKTA